MVLCLVFLALVGNSFWCFVHMVLIVQYSCAVVSVFGSGGKSVFGFTSYSSINILCSSSIHLLLFIVLFGKLSSTSFSVPKKQAQKTNCNDANMLGTVDNGIFGRQRMNN